MLLSQSERNTGRQYAVDMVKMIAIFIMVIIHTLEHGEADLNSGLGYFFDSIAGSQFGAPVFMICMGIGITYSRKNDAATVMKRGGMLLLAGYLLNGVRAIPFPILYALSGEEEYINETIRSLTDVDILQFAGMSFLVIGLFKRLNLSMYWAAIVAVLMSIAGNYVQKVDLGCFWYNFFASPFIGIDSELVNTYFPLFNWFGFVVTGYGLGKLLRRCEDVNRLYLLVLPFAALVYGCYTAYAIPRGIGMYGLDPWDFYHMSSLDVVICISAALLEMSVFHFVALVLPQRLMQGVTRTCADLTKIYIAQWIIIIWAVRAVMTEYFGLRLDMWWLLLVGIVILLLSIGWARVKPLSKLKI